MKISFLPGILLVAGLAACGGSDHDQGATAPGVPPPVGADTSDKFLSQVASVAAASPDGTEPAGLDDSPPTMPENTEPAPVGP